MQYRTKVDTWLIVLLAGAVALPIAVGVVGYVRVGASPAAWIPLTIAVFMVVIICLVAVPIDYDLKTDRLVIRSGLLRWKVPLADIVSITPTSNPLSSPAWSLDRLEVTWMQAGSTRSILISPQRTEEFLREASRRDTKLVVTDGELRRAHS